MTACRHADMTLHDACPPAFPPPSRSSPISRRGGGRRRDALKDWGLAHRFAGSGDRAAIAGLVYDALRRKARRPGSWARRRRARSLLGMLRRERGLDADAIARLCDGARFAPAPLTERARRGARARLARRRAAPMSRAIIRNGSIRISRASSATSAAAEGAALASRAPLDLRVNTLKADARRGAADALAHLAAEPTRWSPLGLRIALGADAKSPAIHAEPAFLKGLVEIQDEGSQLAALLAGAKPGEQVIDLCAGAGGKTLALAAAMENRGQIYATDIDKRRLAPIHERLERAGARNVQVRTPQRRGDDVLADLAGRADLVLIDAPCTGTGTWRRNPDAKWRMRPGALDERLQGAGAVLDRAARAGQAGRPHRLCHLLGAGGGEWRPGARASSARHPEFAVVPPAEVAASAGRARRICSAMRR